MLEEAFSSITMNILSAFIYSSSSSSSVSEEDFAAIVKLNPPPQKKTQDIQETTHFPFLSTFASWFPNASRLLFDGDIEGV